MAEHGALVPGDRLLADGRAVWVSPQTWLDHIERFDGSAPIARAELRDALRAFLDLPVELILVSHGDPILTGARAALAIALAE
jgi:hypothetical protein